MIDQVALEAQLSRLSDEELSALEDELDFCGFTGVPSARILRILRNVAELDSDWKEQLDKGVTPKVPEAF